MSDNDARPRRTRGSCRSPHAREPSQGTGPLAANSEDALDPDDVDVVPDEVRARRRARDAELVGRLRAGDELAFGQLYDDWFDRTFDVVRRIVRDDEVAAEVAQDAFLSAWRNLDSLSDPASFGGWILRIARNGALNRQQRERRSTAVDDQAFAVIESAGGAVHGPAGFAVEDRLGRAATPGAALEDGEIVALVWDAAEALPPRDLEVLDLQLRHGLGPAEIGEVLGMNRNAANQLVHRLRGRLEVAVRARVVWRGGEPSCAVLRERLAQSGVVAFGADAVRVIERHLPSCVTCDERQRLRLQPAALFASLPILVAPVLLKQQAAAALAAAGVPMQGSTIAALSPSAGAGSASGSASGSSSGTGSGSSSSSGTGSGSGLGTGPGAGGGAAGGGAGGGAEPGGVGGTDMTGAGRGAEAATAETAPEVATTARSTSSERAAAAARRRLVIGGMAAAVVLGLLIAGVALRRDRVADVVTADGPTATSPAQGATSTSTTSSPSTRSSSTDLAPSPPPSPPPTDDVPPSTAVAPTVPLTVAPTTTPTTAAPTTTVPTTATATFAIAPPNAPASWIRPLQAGATAPTLSWSVSAAGPVTVAVSGPEIDGTVRTLSTEAKGSYVVCPRRTDTAGTREFCDLANRKGDVFTMTVTSSAGTVLATKAVTLAP